MLRRFAPPSLDHDDFIAPVAEHCSRSVAVVTTPGATLLPWSDSVDAILVNFMPGVASAFATMDVVTGDVNPSARLPITFPMIENEEGMTEEQYPGLDGGQNVTYIEKWSFGYRHYHEHKLEPRFWFGEGQSYTTFEMAKPKISEDTDGGFKVKFTVSNTGKFKGATVPQLYLQLNRECDVPLFMLKKFEKVNLDVGESQDVEWTLDSRDVSVWNIDNDEWTKCKGDAMARLAWSANFQDEETLLDLEFKVQ